MAGNSERKRGHASPYTGTKEETSDTDKGRTYRLPRQPSTLGVSRSYFRFSGSFGSLRFSGSLFPFL